VGLLKVYLDVDLSRKLRSPSSPVGTGSTNREKMLSKCSAEAAQFFSRLLDSAEKQGHIVYWGTAGFSIRAYPHGSDSLVSFAYGFPPNLFEIYFGHLTFPKEKIADIRKEILQLGSFKQSSKKLKLKLEPGNIRCAEEAYALMERRVTELSSN
jgi:hypothetical protein